MFARISTIVLAASCVLLAVATPTPQTTQSCDTGDAQCCQSVQSSSSTSASSLLALLGVILSGAAVPVGLTCSPITGVGVGGTSCTAQPVCCTNNSFNGLIAIGCTPINIAL